MLALMLLLAQFGDAEGDRAVVGQTATISSAEAELQVAIDAGMVDVRAIDSELAAMQDNAEQLRRNSALRLEQVRSLRVRYPDIAITDGASADAIYSALYRLRLAKADAVRPLAMRRKALIHARLCGALATLETGRRQIESSNEYLKMPLSERAEFRASMDEYLKTSRPSEPCPPAP